MVLSAASDFIDRQACWFVLGLVWEERSLRGLVQPSKLNEIVVSVVLENTKLSVLLTVALIMKVGYVRITVKSTERNDHP